MTLNLKVYCEYLKSKLKNDLVKTSDPNKTTRSKCIYIEGSHRRCITWNKVSTIITGRRPFYKDENVIDYEMDSEEEFEEENGEDVNQEGSEEEEDCEGESFIVPDGYISYGENDLDDLSLKDDEECKDKLREAFKINDKKNKNITAIAKPVIMIQRKNEPLCSELLQYKIETSKPYITFPIDLLDIEFNENTEGNK